MRQQPEMPDGVIDCPTTWGRPPNSRTASHCNWLTPH